MWKRMLTSMLSVVITLVISGLPAPPSALAACGQSAPLPPDGISWPIEGKVTRDWSLDCVSDSGHRGIDIAVLDGAEVGAAAAGTVSFAGYTPAEGGGLTVAISHPGSLKTTYLHLARLSVAAGQTVAEGEPVGLAAGPSLHFGLKLEADRELYFNPLDFLLAPESGSAGSSGATGETAPAPEPAPVASGPAPPAGLAEAASSAPSPGAAAAPNAAPAQTSYGADHATITKPVSNAGYGTSTGPLDLLTCPSVPARMSSAAGVASRLPVPPASSPDLRDRGEASRAGSAGSQRNPGVNPVARPGRALLVAAALAILLGPPVLASRLNRRGSGKGLTAGVQGA